MTDHSPSHSSSLWNKICRSGLVWPGVASVAALVILIGLGHWQMDRLVWKNDLIAKIAQRVKAEPITLAQAQSRAAQSGGDIEYTRVRFRGRFVHEEEIHLYWISDGKQGWRVITPMVTASGEIVLVDRGFVPEAAKEAATRSAGQLAGEQTVTGLVRRGAEGRAMFELENNAAANRWFWRDFDGMRRAIMKDTTDTVFPFFVEQERVDVPGGGPQGGITRLDLPNKHLGYALTWYGLAATLVAVFAFFAYSRLRQAEGE